MDKRVEEKKQRLLAALEEGLSQLHLDARRPGVLVPKRFEGDHHLVLNFSYRFDPPDLSVSEWGVRETLSFGGERFTVGVPWSAVYAVASHVTREFWMFPDEMPPELLKGIVERPDSIDALTDDGKPTAKAILREVLKPVERPADEPEAPQEPAEKSPPRRGHLRVVK